MSENDSETTVKHEATLQRLRARVARRPGRWRRRMARSRNSPTPSTGWAACCRDDRRHCRGELDEAA